MKKHVFLVVFLACILTLAFLLVRSMSSQQSRYLLGNVEFSPTCSDGNVPKFSVVQQRFVCTIPSYTIFVQATQHDPEDGVTMYFGMLPTIPTQTPGHSKIYIRKTGTITVTEVYNYSLTAPGTRESWTLYVRKNDTTDYIVATVSLGNSERVFSNQAMSIPVVAGDYIEMKSVQPTFATNPTGTVWAGHLLIE